MTEKTEAAEEIERAVAFMQQMGDPEPQRYIPDESIRRWVELDESADIEIPIKREDIDNLYFCLRSMQDSIVGFQLSMSAWTKGNTEAANAYYRGCISANSRAANRVASFMQGIMDKAVKSDG